LRDRDDRIVAFDHNHEAINGDSFWGYLYRVFLGVLGGRDLGLEGVVGLGDLGIMDYKELLEREVTLM
jgi:hypothetical protein